MRQGEGALSNKMVERVGADGASWILPDDYARKCSYIGCARKTSKEETYRLVREGAKAGGQDWGPLVGGVLCETCFECYCARGMLDKPGKLPHAPGRKCDYEGCLKPHGGSPYHLISEDDTAGGKNWSSIAGNVLCQACYDRFRRRGSLDKPQTSKQQAEKSQAVRDEQGGGGGKEPDVVEVPVAPDGPSPAEQAAGAQFEGAGKRGREERDEATLHENKRRRD